MGEISERLANRALHVARRAPVSGWPDRLVAFRHGTVALIRRRWPALTVAAVVGNLAVFAILLVALRAVDIGSSQLTWIEAFAGWSLARTLQLIPLTPGGVGPVELGLTGILVGFGGPNAAVVAAVLLYRAFTVLPTLVLGLATMAAWRWLAPDGEAGVGRRGGESAGRVKEQSHKDEMSRRAARRLPAAPRAWRDPDALAGRDRDRGTSQLVEAASSERRLKPCRLLPSRRRSRPRPSRSPNPMSPPGWLGRLLGR